MTHHIRSKTCTSTTFNLIPINKLYLTVFLKHHVTFLTYNLLLATSLHLVIPCNSKTTMNGNLSQSHPLKNSLLSTSFTSRRPEPFEPWNHSEGARRWGTDGPFIHRRVIEGSTDSPFRSSRGYKRPHHAPLPRCQSAPVLAYSVSLSHCASAWRKDEGKLRWKRRMERRKRRWKEGIWEGGGVVERRGERERNERGSRWWGKRGLNVNMRVRGGDKKGRKERYNFKKEK